MNTFRSKDNINVSHIGGSPQLDDMDVINICKKLVSNGWVLRIKRRKSTVYVSARKTLNGKRKEIYVSKVTPEDIEKLKKLGLLKYRRRIVPQSCVPQIVVGNKWRGTKSGEHELYVVPEQLLIGTVGLILMLKGYVVVTEKPFSLQRIDIYAEKNGEKLVIEVESSASSYREGLRQLSHVYAELRDKAKYVLVLPTANEQIRNTVESLGFMLWTLDDIMKEFCKLSKGEK